MFILSLFSSVKFLKCCSSEQESISFDHTGVLCHIVSSGSSSCTCIGKNRSFQPSDGSCLCRTGFIFYNELDFKSSTSDSELDCQPEVSPRYFCCIKFPVFFIFGQFTQTYSPPSKTICLCLNF